MSHGSTSESSSSSAQSSQQVDEEAGTGGTAGRRRKLHVQEVSDRSARVEGEPDAPPVPSSDDDPNEALPGRNPVHTEDEDDVEADNEAEANAEEADAGAERAPNDTPVTREELQSMRELHEATARAIARLETAFLAKPNEDINNKRKRHRKRGSDKGKRRKAQRSCSTSETASEEEGEFEEGDDGHIRHSSSAIVQEAFGLLPVDKGWKVRIKYKLALSRWSCGRNGMPFASGAFAACARAAFKPRMVNGTVTLKLYHVAWLEHVVTNAIKHWEARQGRFSNSAGSNAQIVDGLHVLVKGDVTRAIAEFRPEYDAASQTWAWGRHGLRISADGIAAADAVSAEASANRGTPRA
ncbi:unnamed protein product [Closterium sp. NIES-65]|nr:unnamed protein product [Closterium sp. NIES-65]